MQRVGELLKQIEPQSGGDRKSDAARLGAEIKKEGDHLFDPAPITRTEAAREVARSS